MRLAKSEQDRWERSANSPIFTLSKPQFEVFNCSSRFVSLSAGRRFGKTFTITVLLTHVATKPDSLNAYVAPTYKMAKKILWRDLKKMVPRQWIKNKNESDLEMELINGAIIRLAGSDNMDSLRGPGYDTVFLDEVADQKEEVFTEVIRPALSNTLGRCFFFGTPKGFNWFFDIYQKGYDSDFPEYASFQFTTLDGGNVPQSEIDSAKRELPLKVFRQEYLATFENFSGLVYSEFDRKVNVREDIGDIGEDLLSGMDFNVNPMCSAIGTRVGDEYHVFDEFVIPNSGTDEMCRTITAKYPINNNRVHWMTPDASGSARKTSAMGNTDHSIIQEHGFVLSVDRTNPGVKDRTNTVNGMLRSAANKSRLFIHPRCKTLINCLERQTYKEGTVEPDKSLGLDHMPDAVGYPVCRHFPIRGPIRTTRIAI